MSDPSHEFLRVFRMRHSLCAALLDLSRAQGSLIDSDDYPQLMEILKSKQQILNRMQQQNHADSSLWSEWPQAREAISPESRRECDSLLQNTADVLQQLGENERSCTAQLVQRHRATSLELQALSQASQTSRAYQRTYREQTRHALDINQ